MRCAATWPRRRSSRELRTSTATASARRARADDAAQYVRPPLDASPRTGRSPRNADPRRSGLQPCPARRRGSGGVLRDARGPASPRAAVAVVPGTSAGGAAVTPATGRAAGRLRFVGRVLARVAVPWMAAAGFLTRRLRGPWARRAGLTLLVSPSAHRSVDAHHSGTPPAPVGVQYDEASLVGEILRARPAEVPQLTCPQLLKFPCAGAPVPQAEDETGGDERDGDREYPRHVPPGGQQRVAVGQDGADSAGDSVGIIGSRFDQPTL